MSISVCTRSTSIRQVRKAQVRIISLHTAILPGKWRGAFVLAAGLGQVKIRANGDARSNGGWNNYFRNVSVGFLFKNNSGIAIGRLVLIDNFIELATAAGSLSGEDWQTGIRLGTGAAAMFSQVVLRKNLIRDVAEPAGVTSGLKGINVAYCGQLVVENNVIDNVAVAEAVRFANCGSRKFFNNQNSAGDLLRGYDGSAYVLELADQEDDVLLAI